MEAPTARLARQNGRCSWRPPCRLPECCSERSQGANCEVHLRYVVQHATASRGGDAFLKRTHPPRWVAALTLDFNGKWRNQAHSVWHMSTRRCEA